MIRHDFWNVSRVGNENSYCNRRNLYSPSPSLTSYVSSFHYPIFFGRDWIPYSVYSINRGRKLASGYTLDLGQLEIHSNDYFENWAYPESNPAFVPSANFQLAISPVENTEFSCKNTNVYREEQYRDNFYWWIKCKCKELTSYIHGQNEEVKPTYIVWMWMLHSVFASHFHQ